MWSCFQLCGVRSVKTAWSFPVGKEIISGQKGGNFWLFLNKYINTIQCLFYASWPWYMPNYCLMQNNLFFYLVHFYLHRQISNIGLGFRKWDTSCLPIMSRATPSTFGNQFEDYAQQKQNREGWKTDSDWLESFVNQQLEIISWPVSIIHSHLLSKRWIGKRLVWVG